MSSENSADSTTRDSEAFKSKHTQRQRSLHLTRKGRITKCRC